MVYRILLYPSEPSVKIRVRVQTGLVKEYLVSYFLTDIALKRRSRLIGVPQEKENIHLVGIASF